MPNKKVIACGILARELRKVLHDLRLEADVTFLPPGLHVDNCKLEEQLIPCLEENSDREISLLYGCQCHPDMRDWQQKYRFKQAGEPDCIGILLGQKKRKRLSEEARTFYLSPGWLDHWQAIFQEGLGWDETDARMNFGLYDRILLLDSGIGEINDEKLLEFFDYTQVTIEPYRTDLSHLEEVVRRLVTDDKYFG